MSDHGKTTSVPYEQRMQFFSFMAKKICNSKSVTIRRNFRVNCIDKGEECDHLQRGKGETSGSNDLIKITAQMEIIDIYQTTILFVHEPNKNYQY